MIKVIRSVEELTTWRKSVEGQSIGLVPTMGALHLGHETLLQKSRTENQVSVLSIFVNPTQFNDKNDFEKYPVTWETDLRVAERNKVDVLFAPIASEIYADDYKYKVVESELSKRLCGADRPGHFDGVLSVVMKLFNLVRAQKSYFGEKDFQQLALIQGMAKAFFLPLEVIGVPTVRENDGLAMSSRNVRLTTAEREQAPLIYQVISKAKTADEALEVLKNKGWKVDYVTDINHRRFVAVHVGAVRLIDNVQI